MQKKRLFAITIAALTLSTLALTSTASAADNVGKIGVGYTTSNAPLGVRYWLDQELGFDASLGFVINGNEPDVETDDPDDDTDTADYAVDLGGMLALARGKNSVFYGRLGLNLDRRYAVGQDNDGDLRHDSRLAIGVGLWAGIEIFMTELGFPELSFQGAVGLAYESVSGPTQGDDNNEDWSFGSLTTGISLVSAANIGFHYYF